MRQSLNQRNPSVLEPHLVKNVLAVRDRLCINPLSFCHFFQALIFAPYGVTCSQIFALFVISEYAQEHVSSQVEENEETENSTLLPANIPHA